MSRDRDWDRDPEHGWDAQQRHPDYSQHHGREFTGGDRVRVYRDERSDNRERHHFQGRPEGYHHNDNDPGLMDKVRTWWDRNVSHPEMDRYRYSDHDRHEHRAEDRGYSTPQHDAVLRFEPVQRPGGREWPTEAAPSNWASQTYGHPEDSRTGGLGSYGTRPSRDSHLASGTPFGRSSGPGRFAGKGPKGWSRSDERIREDVNEELTRHPDIDASDIEVSVHNAEVTLTGQVDGRSEKHEAEECAWRVSGVKEVQNKLRVKPGAGSIIAEVFRGDNRR